MTASEPAFAGPGASNDAADVTPEQARTMASQQYEADPEGMITAYRKCFGNVFNADDASELISVYNASPESRSKFHSPIHKTTRSIRDDAFSQALKDPGSPAQVLFTAGGSGSGKSRAISGYGENALIYDSTLSNYDGARKTIDQALDSGKKVRIAYLYRDPVVVY